MYIYIHINVYIYRYTYICVCVYVYINIHLYLPNSLDRSRVDLDGVATARDALGPERIMRPFPRKRLPLANQSNLQKQQNRVCIQRPP